MSIGAGDLKKEAIFENPKYKLNFDFIDAMDGNEYNVVNTLDTSNLYW